MKGDFTRSSFNPTKHYSSVRMQQGRVPLDADWNEAQDIGKQLDETTRIDVIGRCGFPENEAGFGFLASSPATKLSFGKGKGYVDGILCVNDEVVSLSAQPHLPDYRPPETDGVYLAYLDVWERHITALEDPDIKEIALGGPDTATRLQTIWQIKLEPLPEIDDSNPPNCADYGASWLPTGRIGSSRISARAELDPTDNRPCIIPAQAGYRRLENQLYRVEIHQGGSVGTATFKWSRDNGSIVSAWNGPDAAGTKLTVTTVGRDNVLRFSPNQWVELSSDTAELMGVPGQFAQVTQAEGQLLEIDRTVNRADFVGNPKVRRWDHQAETGAILVEEGRWITLESGVQVWFESGGTYHTGDYWLIPARTIGATVLWPKDGSGTPVLAAPQGIQHHYCSLGIFQRTGGLWEQLQDCRPLFAPLTDLQLNTQACGEITVKPDDDLQTIIDRIPTGSDAKLCLHPGIWTLTNTVVVANKGHLVISGAGPGTQFVSPNLDQCLLFRDCESVTARDLQVRSGNKPAAGGGLRGAIAFIDCGAVTLEHAYVSCSSFLSRRVSAVQILTRTATPRLTAVCIRHCRITVGHQQVGILIINGAQVSVADNLVETPSQAFNLRGKLTNAQPRELIAAAGRHFINHVAVGQANLKPADLATLNRGDFGLGDPVESVSDVPNAMGQLRLVANVAGWGGQPFAFSSDRQLSARAWSELLAANAIGGPNEAIEAGVVATRLRQLRSRLVQRLFGNAAEISLPSVALLGLQQVIADIERQNRLDTGNQGIVIGGDRTPRFGQAERFANGLFVIDGNLAPAATITNNQIIGFAEGIHIGSSNRSTKAHRSYQLKVEGNNIQLRATSLAAERHGIFIGHAHSVNIQGNTIHVVEPTPTQWNYQREEREQRPIAPTDGIHLTGVYGPLLSIQQNQCIGVTRGIAVTARNAGAHERLFGIVRAWRVTDNAYAGMGRAEVLSSTPDRLFQS